MDTSGLTLPNLYDCPWSVHTRWFTVEKSKFQSCAKIKGASRVQGNVLIISSKQRSAKITPRSTGGPLYGPYTRSPLPSFLPKSTHILYNYSACPVIVIKKLLNISKSKHTRLKRFFVFTIQNSMINLLFCRCSFPWILPQKLFTFY